MVKFDFDESTYVELPNFKGGEGITRAYMFFDGTNRIMKGILKPGCSIGLHTHETSSEIIYFLEGTPKVIYNGEEYRFHKGECHYCKKGNTHTMINDTNEDVVIFAVVAEQ